MNRTLQGMILASSLALGGCQYNTAVHPEPPVVSTMKAGEFGATLIEGKLEHLLDDGSRVDVLNTLFPLARQYDSKDTYVYTMKVKFDDGSEKKYQMYKSSKFVEIAQNAAHNIKPGDHVIITPHTDKDLRAQDIILLVRKK